MAAAVGMALGVVLGDFASLSTARGGRLERLPIPAAAAAAAAVAPNFTAVAPARLVPVIVTTVPPACGPVAGSTDDTAGAAGT